MMYSNILISLVVVLLLNACGGGGPHVDCIGCFPPVTPVTLSADAGPDQTATEGDTAKLSANAVAATNCYADFEWSQTSGPNVLLLFAPAPNLKFETPPISETTELKFQLKATCRDSTTDYDFVTIFVEPTSASALCLQAPIFATTYAWTNSDCTTDSVDIEGGARIATIYRQREAEPNDVYGSANALTFPTRIAAERISTDVAASVTGMGGAIRDFYDFYIFTPPETGNYEIFLCNDPLVCMRGTVSDRWLMELSDNNFDQLASTYGEVKELKLRVALEVGLPYYVLVRPFEASSGTWEYNLTIMSED